MRSKKNNKKICFLLNNKCGSVTHSRIVCSSCVCNFNEIDQYITPRNSAKNVCTNPRWLPHGGSNYPKKIKINTVFDLISGLSAYVILGQKNRPN